MILARKKMLNVQKASPSVKIAIIDSSTFCDGSISEKQPRQTLHWNPYFDDF